MPSAFSSSSIRLARAHHAPAPQAAGPLELVDALVPDAHLNAAVAGIRGLGGAGLKVLAAGPSWSAAGLWSRYTAGARIAPSIVEDPRGYAGRLQQLTADRGPLVVYPSREETIDAMVATAPAGTERSCRSRPPTCWTGCATRPTSWTPPTPPGSRHRSCCSTARRASCAPDFGRPVVVKPAGPVGSLKTAKLMRDITRARDAPGMGGRRRAAARAGKGRGPLVSVELVLGREGNIAARFQHVTQRTWPSAAGSIALATSVEPDEALVYRTASMLADIGYWGLAQVDFVGHAVRVRPAGRQSAVLPLSATRDRVRDQSARAVARRHRRPAGRRAPPIPRRRHLPVARGGLRGRGARRAAAAVRPGAVAEGPVLHGRRTTRSRASCSAARR